MQKSHTAFYSSLFLSAFTVIGCGKFKGHTNMQSEDPLNSPKRDAVFNFFGLPNRSDIKNFSTENLKDNLSLPPTNISPTKENQNEYKKIKSLALKYAQENIHKSDAIEIVSVKKFVDVLKETNFDESYYDETKINKENFTAIPFIEKNTGNVVDLSAYKTRTGINIDSKFKVYGTKNGNLETSIFAEGTVYLFTYKLKNSDIKHSAIITVPDTLTESNELPLILYAHGGDSGVSFRNIAQLMQNTLSQGIVAAPSFPGEAICAITTLGGSPGKPENLFHRSCADANRNVAEPVVKAEGARSPLDEDVSSLIGVHNAITKFVLTTDPNKPQIKFTSDTIDQDFNTKIKYLSFNSKTSIIPFFNSPQTLGVAESRGGATLLAAIGRIGLYYQHTLTELIKAPQLDLAAAHKIPKLPLLSGAVLYYSPSSLLMGAFAIPLQNMLNGELFEQSQYNMLPMVPDLNKNKYMTDYRNAPKDNHEQELNNLVGWLAASDTTFLGPYVSVAMQNWTYTLNSISKNIETNIATQMEDSKNAVLVATLKESGAFKNGTPSAQALIAQLPALKQRDKTLYNQTTAVISTILKTSMMQRESAPSSIALLHATHDQMVPYTQSLITKKAFDKVFDLIHNENGGESQKEFTSFRIPPVGTQLFAFQPQNNFYAVEIGEQLLNKEKCTTNHITFNKVTNKCFGEKRPFLAHGDAAFATSTLINQSVNKPASNQEHQLHSILKQGIPRANNATGALTAMNIGYEQVKQGLKNEIKKINQNTDTTNVATRKSTKIKFEKEQQYLDNTKLQTTCNTTSPTGICYIKNGPQFHRPLYLESIQKDSLIEQKWDAAATQSVWTPSDVLAAWFASSAKDVLSK